MDIKAVFFDLGETIFTYGDVNVNALFAEGARITYDYLRKIAADGQATGKLLGLRSYFIGHIVSIKLHYMLSNITRREFDCMALLDKKARRMGFNLSPAQQQELAWLWYKPLGDIARIEDDLHDTLSRLRDMSLQMAVISNTFLPAAVLDRHLERHNLLQYFPVRIYSSQTVYRKPDMRIYRRALGRLNLPADSVVMVGDRLREDIKGAARMGMKAVMKKAYTNVKTRLKAARDGVVVIENIAELPGIIEQGKV